MSESGRRHLTLVPPRPPAPPKPPDPIDEPTYKAGLKIGVGARLVYALFREFVR